MARRILFQLHWIIGISAGIVLAVVGITGAMLSFEDDLLRWMNRDVMEVEPNGTSPLPPSKLLLNVGEAHPKKRITSLTLYGDPRRTARVTFADRESLHIDPYTGKISGAPYGAKFFRQVRQVHRWLAAGEFGKQIVGASTVLLVLLCLTGLYLRWPRRTLDWRAWLAFQWSRKGRSFLWHLHAVAGTWVLLAYLLMGLTGLYWSYEWYRNSLFAITGTSRPAAPVNSGRSQGHENASRPSGPDIALAWATFQREARAFSSVTLRLPQRPEQPLQLNYLDRDAPHDRALNRMALDPATGAVLRQERYAEKGAGAKLMSSIFALHSGSFFGLPGMIALMLASLLMPLFTITGWMMYLGRRRRTLPLSSSRPVDRSAARTTP